MALHYFHCTDGVDMVIDRRGRDIRSFHGLERAARRLARTVMAVDPRAGDWSRWAVNVYDARGVIAIVPFPAQPARSRPRPRARPKRRPIMRVYPLSPPAAAGL